MNDSQSSRSLAGDPFKQQWRRIGLGLCFFIPILIYAYNAHFARLCQDDFRFAYDLAHEGFWGSFTSWYNGWTGSYSATLAQELFVSPGPRFPGLMLSLYLITWLIGMVWLMYEIVLWLKLPRPRFLACLMGSLLLATTIDGMRMPYQSLYWLAGAAVHISPIIMLTVHLAFSSFVIRRTPHGKIPIIPTISAPFIIFVTAGFSPTASAHMLTLFILILIGSWRYTTTDWRRTVWPMLILAIIAVIVAMIVITVAPGTAIRQLRFPDQPSLPILVRVTVLYAFHSMITAIGRAPFTLLLTLTLSGIISFSYHPSDGAHIQTHKWRYMGLIVGIGLLLIMACFSTGVYAMSNYLPPRAVTTPVLTFTMMVAALGYVVGVDIRRTYQHSSAERVIVLAVLAVLMVLGPIRLAVEELRFTPDMATYAQEWDAMDKQLTEAAANGETRVVVPKFTMDLGEVALNAPLGEDPSWYANRIAAMYYGVEAIIAR